MNKGKDEGKARRRPHPTEQCSQGTTPAAIRSEMGATKGKSPVVNEDVGPGSQQERPDGG